MKINYIWEINYDIFLPLPEEERWCLFGNNYFLLFFFFPKLKVQPKICTYQTNINQLLLNKILIKFPF